MKVTELLARLAELEREGFGDRRVIDDNGNDVMEAVGPLGGPVGGDPDSDAVMLHCYVDYKGER